MAVLWLFEQLWSVLQCICNILSYQILLLLSIYWSNNFLSTLDVKGANSDGFTITELPAHIAAAAGGNEQNIG